MIMSKKAFDKIAEGLNEALAIARGEAKPVNVAMMGGRTCQAEKEDETGRRG